ncbi:phosphoadenosine phosphosulfate reductase family protein [Robinsoniella peoriensis]|uniref:phosphoadenosine phosphosulfate reductase domain-containing protein n=1 Tax=Robinsoniella peoriensis TaxID=180332 RepID=UPI0005C7AD44|nr:phosphoadenosine phosphosulfate reductase family protein [Robinsoniella peoriensis]
MGKLRLSICRKGRVNEAGRKDKLYVASLSGGKDSTAMVLRLIEEKWPLDLILFCDTGLEFPQMYEHIRKLEQSIPVPIVWLKEEKGFEYYFLHHQPKRKNQNLVGKSGFSWAGPRNRWCTSTLKVRVIERYLSGLRKDYEIVQYIGIAADEPQRVREYRYPLVEWGMTEKNCLEYCYERGYDWSGLYRLFSRVSCWCCPLQGLEELRTLRREFPQLWKQLLEWESKTWRNFRADYSADELEIRFHFEEERLRDGKSIRGKEFFRELKERLGRRG